MAEGNFLDDDCFVLLAPVLGHRASVTGGQIGQGDRDVISLVEYERGPAVDDTAPDDGRLEFEPGGVLEIEAPGFGGSGCLFHGNILIRF